MHRVMMNGIRLNLEIRNPLIVPSAVAIRTPRIQAGTGGSPQVTIMVAHTMLMNFTMAPRDKSIPPVKSTVIMPHPAIPIMETCRSTFMMFCPVRNCGLKHENNAIMPISRIVIANTLEVFIF